LFVSLRCNSRLRNGNWLSGGKLLRFGFEPDSFTNIACHREMPVKVRAMVVGMLFIGRGYGFRWPQPVKKKNIMEVEKKK
jgi:hypothetical protein